MHVKTEFWLWAVEAILAFVLKNSVDTPAKKCPNFSGFRKEVLRQ